MILELKGIFTWKECKVFLSDSAYVRDGILIFVENPTNEMLVCECKTNELAEEIANGLNKMLEKWDKLNSLLKETNV